jgi:putative hydrolase of the HAD superfamily
MDFAGFEELVRLVPSAASRSEIRNRWIRSPAVQRFERGEITAKRFADAVIEEFQIDLSPQEFLSSFVEWAREPTPVTISLLVRLRNTYRIAALSNANELHTPLHRRRFEQAIDTFYFSDEIGHVKPDRAIFDHVVDDLGVPPHRIAYFDDTPVNVEAALDAGLIAHSADGIDELRTRLIELGLL